VPANPPALITVSDDGNMLYAMLVNASWTQDWPGTITVKDFAISWSTGTVLVNDDLDAIPLVQNREDFVHPLALDVADSTVRFVLPAHSVAFLAIGRAQ